MKNKKLFILIIILFIILGFLGSHLYKKYFCHTDISSRNNEFTISVPNKINYKIKDSTDENLYLDFYSVKDEMFFYSNIIDKQDNINLFEAVSKEKENLVLNLQDVNIVSDVSQFNIGNFNSYKYSYTYKDTTYGNDLYAEVVWIESNSKIYIFDLEVIKKNMNKYKSVFDFIENSFVENNVN